MELRNIHFIRFLFDVYFYCKFCDLFYNQYKILQRPIFKKSHNSQRHRARKFLSIVEFFKFANEARNEKIVSKAGPDRSDRYIVACGQPLACITQKLTVEKVRLNHIIIISQFNLILTCGPRGHPLSTFVSQSDSRISRSIWI